MSNTNDLHAFSGFMLVEFSASVWTARKLDRKQTEGVLTHANAKSKAAARVNKNLLAGRPELDEIQAIVGAARTYVYDSTLPWSDNGQRLLAVTRFLEFSAQMEVFRAQFVEKVEAFCTLYPTLITAQAMALGDMFDRSEYPLTTTIRSKFAFGVEFADVPRANDLRVDVSDQVMVELQERVRKSTEARAAKVAADMRTRLAEHLERMTDRLTTDLHDNPELKPRRFNESLVTSALSLCDLVKDYETFGDHRTRLAGEALSKVLTGVSPQALRDDPTKREDVRKAAQSLLTSMSIL